MSPNSAIAVVLGDADHRRRKAGEVVGLEGRHVRVGRVRAGQVPLARLRHRPREGDPVGVLDVLGIAREIDGGVDERVEREAVDTRGRRAALRAKRSRSSSMPRASASARACATRRMKARYSGSRPTRGQTTVEDMTAVAADGLVKHYPGRSGAVEAVRGVDLRVEAGEVFGFLGPNGAGKSTTVKMLTTLLSITSGTATVAGVDVASEPDEVRRRIGVALQEAGLDPRQTGRELLHLQARLFGLPAGEADDRTGELLALVELEDAADRSIKGYSGGMKRRLDLATALVHAPQVLFLDEPTTGLDPASRLTIWDEVRRINQRGTTVFLTTQYLEEADQLCDRLAIIDDGRIVRDGTPTGLKADLRERRGLASHPTLDDVFLDATGRTRDRIAGEVHGVSA
jgi:ABC-2 type transport system ATP-binding protein